jgi:hypothetical protein
MREMNMKKAISKTVKLLGPAVLAMLLIATGYAAVPGITGTGTPGTFNLTAQQAYLNQPDGSAVYSWGYGCQLLLCLQPLRRLQEAVRICRFLARR